MHVSRCLGNLFVSEARSLAPGSTEAEAGVLSCPDLLLLGLQYRLGERLTGFMARAPL